MRKLIFMTAVALMAFASAIAQDRQQADQRTRDQQVRDQRTRNQNNHDQNVRDQNARDRNSQSTYGDRSRRTSYHSTGSRYRSRKHYRKTTTTYHPERN
jgi:Ni/Co efflux regulator RcnB